MEREMVKKEWGGEKDEDIIMVIIDEKGGLNENEEEMIERMKDVRKKKVMVMKKVDSVDKKVIM